LSVFFAWLFTAPVIYFWTGQLNFLQPLNNFLFTPVFSFASIGMALVGLVLFYLGIPGANLILNSALKVTEGILWAMEKLDGLSSGLG
jgi:hypothetical protein